MQQNLATILNKPESEWQGYIDTAKEGLREQNEIKQEEVRQKDER